MSNKIQTLYLTLNCVGLTRLTSRRAVTGKPVAWKLVPAAGAPLYANPKSDHARRGAFATKNVWVTPFAEDEFYPAGNYPLEPNPVGIKDWTDKVRRAAWGVGFLSPRVGFR